MANDMDDLKDLKSMWEELNNRVSQLESENKELMHKVMRSNFRTGREKLIKKYIGFICVECVMIVFLILFFTYNPMINEKYRMLTLLYWIAFFVFDIVFDSYLLYQLRKINIYESSTNEVARKATRNWKLHKIGILIGIPFAFGAIALFALAVDANIFVIYGMIAGGIIGLVIGLSQLHKFKIYYSQLQTGDNV